ncbi:heme-binding protein : Membrane-bound dehydrogenase domain protein OS=Pirellula staleyi (strain ATCC 27377 / DSM 6068 / ICPB 4128) GN=Psta_0686 PE=4 SV=1: GSDH: HEAT_2: Cytochrom_C [Gemmata massiliana]|uniref:Cytochrome c domain-containing protein n=1 Tax=Gemmata massiliana TaxID=1210884 RepID=A0A6P2D2D3_9BACT|nr:PVC-type heme-binding CxxCH protein [Gemmata massiliana]VTR95451.1 heme-binding protein : Membrane-bound dehydrogenase domain protein OS=Pirellula staleyi (strain ATCC 27377 / DSM 6068 / ICPB 4128) GN=Psta_0686 PE=4 SV=1: GSDH: HEAT_2: Cytochrom_C [Gemmata massiliana]
MHPSRIAALFALFALVSVGSAIDPATGSKAVTEPALPDGTDTARKQIATFKVPAGLKVELFAAEPMLASPVAIGLDEKNRVFVAEEYRFNRGTEENRTRSFLLDDDLQIRTPEDRLAMYRKHANKFDGGMDWFTKHSDQIRLLEDTKGTGKADKSTVFAGGFNAPLDGLAAGVMATNGDVYFTCIPNLWKLKDTKGAGRADVREALLTGFGVNCAFLGHDLHGLAWGPDGKLYFSVGDRGFHVTSKEGATHSGPRTGAVFRCNPDGTEFEVVHRGLRNPQELAFDQYGNLFADDNNCDKGDHARLVYVVEDGNSGWNMPYQTIPGPYTGGPWFAERLWHLPHAGQPAYIVPPVGKIGTGPSGFLFTSGTSLPERYKNSFVMCNYTGGPEAGLEAFRVKAKGAGFEIEDYHDFFKPIKATDAEFSYDGKLYVADFVNLDWGGKSLGGRIYTVFDPAKIDAPVVKDTKKLFAEGFDKRSADELTKLLGHADQRVRQRAQFALVERAGRAPAIYTVLANVAAKNESQFARIHALWALGQLARKNPATVGSISARLTDADDEVRAQAAKLVGDVGSVSAAATLVERLTDANPRVRFFAAQSLGKLKHKPAVGPLFDVLKANKDEDAFIRHACVAALTRIADADSVVARSGDPSAAVRMAVVLVQRKLADQRVAKLLADADPLVRTEAARAIHDLPMDDLLPPLAAQLAKLVASPIADSDALARRAINANYRLGGTEHARAVLAAVTCPTLSTAVRAEALAALKDWSNPPPRDRVTGFWRTEKARDAAIVRGVVENGLEALLAGTTGRLQTDAVGLIVAVGARADEARFASLAGDPKADPNLRVAAVRFFAGHKSKQADAVLTAALKSNAPLVRAEARELVAKSDPTRGVPLLDEVLADEGASTRERQQALVAIAALKTPAAERVLDAWTYRLAAGEVPADLQVDVLDALKSAPSPLRDRLRLKFESALPQDPVGKFKVSLTGGDADAGRDVFFNHTAAQCVRCHTINGSGGTAGPDLTKVVARNPVKTREHLLESLVLPSAKIAPGFGTVTLALADGRTVGGTLLSEEKGTLVVQRPDGKKVTVQADEIERRSTALSPMPAVDRTLTTREMRDLIEFLMTLK